MATVSPSDVVLNIVKNSDPSVIDVIQPGGPDPNAAGKTLLAGAAWLKAPEIEARATVPIRGKAGEDLSLWRIGFIQLKFITTDWAHYRGDKPEEGSIFLAMDRPPSRQPGYCRDTLASDSLTGTLERTPFIGPIIFYYPEQGLGSGNFADLSTAVLPLGTTIPASGRLNIKLRFTDQPQRFYDLRKVNNKATKFNWMYSLMNSAAYATVLAVQKGAGKPIEALKSFQWNVRWRAHFERKGGLTVLKVPKQAGDVTDMNISHHVNGGPADVSIRAALLDTHLPHCNAVIREAHKKPVLLESKNWEDWKVTQ
jgi:hypothetical protein